VLEVEREVLYVACSRREDSELEAGKRGWPVGSRVGALTWLRGKAILRGLGGGGGSLRSFKEKMKHFQQVFLSL
jgi:hypothetical protein